MQEWFESQMIEDEPVSRLDGTVRRDHRASRSRREYLRDQSGGARDITVEHDRESDRMRLRKETGQGGNLQPGYRCYGDEWLAGALAANASDGLFDNLALAGEYGVIGTAPRPTASVSGTSARSIATQADGVVLPIPISPPATTRIPSDAALRASSRPTSIAVSNSSRRSVARAPGCACPRKLGAAGSGFRDPSQVIVRDQTRHLRTLRRRSARRVSASPLPAPWKPPRRPGCSRP